MPCIAIDTWIINYTIAILIIIIIIKLIGIKGRQSLIKPISKSYILVSEIHEKLSTYINCL